MQPCPLKIANRKSQIANRKCSSGAWASSFWRASLAGLRHSKTRSVWSAASLLLLSAALFSWSAAGQEGEDWPRFLGPRANNISGESHLLDQWPTNGPPLLWE